MLSGWQDGGRVMLTWPKCCSVYPLAVLRALAVEPSHGQWAAGPPGGRGNEAVGGELPLGMTNGG